MFFGKRKKESFLPKKKKEKKKGVCPGDCKVRALGKAKAACDLTRKKEGGIHLITKFSFTLRVIQEGQTILRQGEKKKKKIQERKTSNRAKESKKIKKKMP